MGNAQSVKTVNLEGVFEHTVFDEAEIEKITRLYSQYGIDGILNCLLPLPLLPLILSFLKEQSRREGLSGDVTIDQIVYLLDTLHPRQSLDNKRDLAWKVYDGNGDGCITKSDLLTVYGHILPGVKITTHRVIADRLLATVPDRLVKKDNFHEILSDDRLTDLFTRSI